MAGLSANSCAQPHLRDHRAVPYSSATPLIFKAEIRGVLTGLGAVGLVLWPRFRWGQ